MKKKAEAVEISIHKVQQGRLEVCIVGSSPLVMNRMSEKAKHELLCPRGRMTLYDKQTNQKHDPLVEFRAAPHRIKRGDSLLAMPSTAFKGALSTAALDLPGTKKAQIARLTYVEGEYVEVFGIPKLYMAVVRSADMNKTPDIRTRVIIEEWAARFTVDFVEPLLKAQAVTTLIANGGIYVGIGDGRPEKGKLSFGRYRVVSPNDSDFKRIVKYGGRKLQEAAMLKAEPYDDESKEMLTYHAETTKKRNFDMGKPNGKIPGAVVTRRGRQAEASVVQ
jgi:hypothetical protein